jgi:hypothetical protein
MEAAGSRRETEDKQDIVAWTRRPVCGLGEATAGRVPVQPLGYGEGEAQRSGDSQHTSSGSHAHDQRVVPVPRPQGAPPSYGVTYQPMSFATSACAVSITEEP